MTPTIKDKLIKQINFNPAFDKRSSIPSKNYGIHGVDMIWSLGHPKQGYITWTVFTNWYLPEVQKELEVQPINPRFPHLFFLPQPADLGYHSLVPQFEGQKPVKNCKLLDNQDCYCDGSGLVAQEVFNLLVKEGQESVWKFILEQWKYRFENTNQNFAI